MFMVLGRKQILKCSSTLFCVCTSEGMGFPEDTKRHEGLQSHSHHSDHLLSERSVEPGTSLFGRKISSRLTVRNITVGSHFELFWWDL